MYMLKYNSAIKGKSCYFLHHGWTKTSFIVKYSTSIQLGVAIADKLADKVNSTYPELLPNQCERSHSSNPASHSPMFCDCSQHRPLIPSQFKYQVHYRDWIENELSTPTQTHATILTKKRKLLGNQNHRLLGRKYNVNPLSFHTR